MVPPKIWKYRDMRDQVAKLERVASYAASTILFNHIFSMIDAAWTRNTDCQKYSMDVKPFFNYNNKYGIGGLSFSLIW